jgi:hypothetical protein
MKKVEQRTNSSTDVYALFLIKLKVSRMICFMYLPGERAHSHKLRPVLGVAQRITVRDRFKFRMNGAPHPLAADLTAMVVITFDENRQVIRHEVCLSPLPMDSFSTNDSTSSEPLVWGAMSTQKYHL